jgi:hypothetical protein
MGVFLAGGPGVRPGVRLEPLSILDVAPVLLHGLGLGLPADLEGQVPAAAFEPGYLEARPVCRLAADAAGQPGAGEAGSEIVYDAEAEAVMLKRLRALGYVS